MRGESCLRLRHFGLADHWQCAASCESGRLPHERLATAQSPGCYAGASLLLRAPGYCCGGFGAFGSLTFCRRTDSLTIAIAIAPASTARPAIWPPRRRASSGTSAAVVLPLRAERALAGGRLTDPVPVDDAPTVGKRPAGFVGETLVPAMGDTVPLGAGVVALVTGVGVGVGLAVVATTTSVAWLMNCSPSAGGVANTVADICHCCPTIADVGTSTTASSSSAWPVDKSPSVHVLPLDSGQTMNAGDPNVGALSTLSLTTTSAPVLNACSVHTHITKLA